MKTKVVVEIIGATATIIAAVIGAFNFGKAIEQRDTQTQIKEVMGDVINVTGDENEVTINDIENFMQNYEQLQSDFASLTQQKDTLVQQNTQYYNDLANANKRIEELNSGLNNEIDNLKSQLDSIPILNYKNLALCIDVNDIPINTSNSMVTIDGRDYFSKGIIEKLIADDKSFTIKDNTIFIGTVIAEKANLLDKYTIDYHGFEIYASINDSYNQPHNNALVGRGDLRSYRIFNVEKSYTCFKCKIAPGTDFNLDGEAVVTILADEKVVYTTDVIKKITESFETPEISINNCSRLEIRLSGKYTSQIIITDAILYNF